MTMAELLSYLAFILAIIHYSIATDTLTPNQSLQDGETLVSAKETFALGFFSPGGSKNRYVGIWYNKLQGHPIVWVANRCSPLSSTNGRLELNGNGTLTINSAMIFLPMPSVTLTNPMAQLLDDGNFVIREANSSEPSAWQSFDYPTDTLLSGMKLGWDLRTGRNRNLTSWRSKDDPSPGSYVVSMDLKGIPQFILWSGSAKKWRSGPWNGVNFNNAEEPPKMDIIRHGLVSNKDEVYYMYNVTGTKMVARGLVDHSGVLKNFVYIESASKWNALNYPRSECEDYSKCGPYGICDINNWPMCSCLQGFTPKSPQEYWPLMDASLGCKRLTELDCKNKSDGFMTIKLAALPDTVDVILYPNISLNECRAKCLKNCSCTAYASANISGAGVECIVWFTELMDLRITSQANQDVFVRLAAIDLASNSRKSSKKNQVESVVLRTVFSIVALIISLICFYSWRKKRMAYKASIIYQLENYTRGDDELELKQLPWNALMEATSNFAKGNVLGKGGFGLVYKGKLSDGREIAVKRLCKNSTQGSNEFKNEVTFIARLQHRNLVRLLGYCIRGDEKVLVYEYMANGSLDVFLFDKEKGVHLDWQTRFRIIVGIARGLLYLHQDSRLRIIHRDLKASNILLDTEMDPKISDFGLARNFGEHETMTKTRKIVGTYGYMSPEYVLDGIFSVKLDVFSFGVLILEIISGQRNRVLLSQPHLYILGKAWNLWNEGKVLDLLDPLISNSFSMTHVMRCINIALLCVQEKPEDRPIMSSVVALLANDDAQLPEPKAPGFKAIFSAKYNSGSNQADLYTLNTITLTELQIGR